MNSSATGVFVRLARSLFSRLCVVESDRVLRTWSLNSRMLPLRPPVGFIESDLIKLDSDRPSSMSRDRSRTACVVK